jgi:hypothetical protein
MAQAVASHLLWGGLATPLFIFYFFHRVNGVAEPPPWLRGWFGHPQTSRFGGGRITPMAQGVANHPLWGGSATPLLFLFFNFIIYLIFKIKFYKNNILMGKKRYVLRKVTTVNKIGRKDFMVGVDVPMPLIVKKKKNLSI